jgi:hypothetical protein
MRQNIATARYNNKLNKIKAKSSPETAELKDKKTDTNAKRLQNIGTGVGLATTMIAGIRELLKKDKTEKTGGSTQYKRGGKTTNKPVFASPKSAPKSASKKAAVFKKGGNTKKK